MTSGLLFALAASTAAENASWVFWVHRFGSSAMSGNRYQTNRKVDNSSINFSRPFGPPPAPSRGRRDRRWLRSPAVGASGAI